MYSGNQRVAHTAFFRRKFHLLSRHARLHYRRNDRNDERRKYHEQRRHDERRSVREYLENVRQREERRKSYSKHDFEKPLNEQIDVCRAAGKFARAVIFEKVRRKRKNSHHRRRFHGKSNAVLKPRDEHSLYRRYHQRADRHADDKYRDCEQRANASRIYDVRKEYFVKFRRQKPDERDRERRDGDPDDVCGGHIFFYVSQKSERVYFFRRERLIKRYRLFVDSLLVLFRHFYAPSGIRIDYHVARNAARDQRDDATVLAERSEHRSRRVLVPPFFKGHVAPHYPVRTHEIFERFVHIGHAVWDFFRLYAIRSQYLAYRVGRRLPLIVHRRGKAAAHNDTGGSYERVLKRLVIGAYSVFYLFVKPTHIRPPVIIRSLRASCRRRRAP